MKNYYLFLLALTFVACSNESDSLVSCEESEKLFDGISTVFVEGENVKHAPPTRASSIEGEKALRFKDYATFEKFKMELQEMSDEEKSKMAEKFGVKTLHSIADIADDELEAIGNNATSETEFRNHYKLYKEKYTDVLISNCLDTTDLTLYVPDGDNIKTYICNRNNVYVIDDEVIKEDFKKELSESIIKLSKSNSSEPPLNGSEYSPTDGKKVYFQAKMINTNMWIEMHCKKKMWYGWKNDPNRSYYFTTSLTNIQFLVQGQYGQEMVTGPLPMYIHNNKNKCKNGINYILGRIYGGNTITGYIYAWTDLTSEYDANNNEIWDTVNGFSMPRCLNSKAQIIKINLKPTY